MGVVTAPSHRTTTLVAGLLILIWGTTWAGVRLSLDGYPPLLGVAMRFALGSMVLFGLALYRGVNLRPTTKRAWLWLVQATCAFGLSYGLVYWAEQWVPSGLVAVLFSTMPLFVTFFAYFMLDERLDVAGVAGIVMAFLGIGVIFSQDFASLGGVQVRFAAAVVLLAPIAAAIAQVVVKKWGRDVHALAITAPPMMMSALAMAVLSLMFEGDKEIQGGLVPTLAVLYLALIGSAVTFSLFFWLLQHVTAIKLSLIAFGTPVVAVAIGTLLLDEPLTWFVVVGALMVISGVAFVAMPRRG